MVRFKKYTKTVIITMSEEQRRILDEESKKLNESMSEYCRKKIFGGI